MADDIPFANGAGPGPRPRRRMYAAPFGALQNDAPDIQYGNGTGPAPRQAGTNALAAQGMRPIAQPFGMLPTAGLTSQPPPPPMPPEPAPQPIAAPFGALQSAPMSPPQYSVAPQNSFPVDSINALLQALRRRF